MKLLILSAILFFTPVVKIWSQANKDTLEFQAGSKIVIGKVNNSQIEKLALLGKVWGFLKYYHPVIAKGNKNWDFELFRFLPTYLASKTKKESINLVENWITGLGDVEPCTQCSNEMLKTATHKPDLKWIDEKSVLGDSLSLLLNRIKNNRHQGSSYYVSAMPAGNPKIENENAYTQFLYPDDGYRLLSLYRYWNIIQYWFPYKHLIGEDWNNVLTEFIPKILGADNSFEYINITQQLIARIHDTHANISGNANVFKAFFPRFVAPVRITFIKTTPVISNVLDTIRASAGNLRVGDIIEKVGSQSIDAIITRRLPNLAASNFPTQLRSLSYQLLSSNDSMFDITINRNGKSQPAKVIGEDILVAKNQLAYDFPYLNDSSFFFINPDIGYINIRNIKRGSIDSIFSILENSKGLIIDNRQYPRDFVIYNIAQKLLPEKKPFAKYLIPSLDYPGAMMENPNLGYVGTNNNNYYKGKVLILINEQTQSSAEFHTMAFRLAPKAVVVGSATAGADGNVSELYLPGGIRTFFSGISILYPNGRETQRIGIIPDIEVKRTIEGIKAKRDELLEKAIDVIYKSEI